MSAARSAPVAMLSLGQARALVTLLREREAAMLAVLKRWQAHFPEGATNGTVPNPFGLDVTLAQTDAIIQQAQRAGSFT